MLQVHFDYEPAMESCPMEARRLAEQLGNGAVGRGRVCVGGGGGGGQGEGGGGEGVRGRVKVR